MLIKEKVVMKSEIVQNPGNIVSDMDGEKVMFNMDNGNYYNLGELGGAIWERVKEPITVEALVKLLRSEYEVEQTECENHVISFVNKLYSEGLISVVNR